MEEAPQQNVSWRNIMDTADAEAIKRDTPAPPINNHHHQQKVTLSPVSRRLFKGGDVVGTGTPTTVTPPQSSTGTPVPPVPPVLVPPPLLDQPLHQPALGGGGNPSYSAMISPRSAGVGGGGGGYLRVNMAGTVDSNTTASGTDGGSTYKYLHEDASQDPYRPLGQAQGEPGGRGAAMRQLKLKKWKERDENSNSATAPAASSRSSNSRGRSPGPRNESFNRPTNSGGSGPHQNVVVPNKMTTASGHSARISDLTMNTGDGGSSLEFSNQVARSSTSGQQQQQQQLQHQEANAAGGAMPSIVENNMNSGAFRTATTKDSLPPESAGAASVATKRGLRFSEQEDTELPEVPRTTTPAAISKEDEAAGMATTLNALKNIKMGGDDEKNKEEEEKKRLKRERLIWFGDHVPVCLGPTLICVAIALIVVSSIKNGGDGGNTTLAPSFTPISTMPPTSLSLTRHESQLYSFINEMLQSPQSRSYSSYLDTSEWIQDKDSPQFQAFSWLLYDPLFESLLQDEQDRKLSKLRGVGEGEESRLVPLHGQERSLQRASASINLVSFLSSHQRQTVMQRFAMATLYYATGGPNWKRNSNWLSDQPVCSWYVNNFGRQCLTTSGNGDYKDDQRDIGDFITSLELDNNELQGTIPNELAILSETLHTLILSNNSLSGSLPAFLLGRTLRDSSFDTPKLPGNDDDDDSSAILRTLHLDQNQLTGSIPSEWVDMDDGDGGDIAVISRLEDLKLNDNTLSGMIPKELWQKATSLVEVHVGGNPQLRGSIPTDIGNLISLRTFHGQDMAWVGSLPSEIGTCFQLRELNLSQSEGSGPKAEMEGSIPSELWELPRLRLLDLEGLNLRGRLPKIGQLVFLTSTLRSIRLGRNKLQGTISTMFGLLTNLQTLQLQYNDLGEGGTTNSQSTNEFLPAVPTELGSLTKLTTFNLSNNPKLGLSSPIRDMGTEFGKLVKLQELDLSSCGLVGSIPSELGLLTELRQLLLDGNNQWTGTVPIELGQLNLLEKLHIGSDVGSAGDDFFVGLGLVGTIPEQSLNGFSSTLKSLALPNNQLTGALPAILENFSKLTHLDLSNNQFTSTLPAGFAKLTELESFDVSGNALTGNVPSEYSAWKSIIRLHIEKNSLTGVVGDFCDNFYFDADVEGSSVVADCPDEVECSCCTSCCQLLPGNDDCVLVEQRPNV